MVTIDQRTAVREGCSAIFNAEPPLHFTVEGLDVVAADDIEVRREGSAWRIEEAGVNGVRIRTPDQPERRDMMRRHHPRVAWMELPEPSAPRQFRRHPSQ